MPIPDYQTLMLPALRRLAERRWKSAELVGALSDEFGLSADERTVLLPSGRQAIMTNRTYWALTNLKWAGLVVQVRRGEHEASEAGRVLLASPPERITKAFLTQRYPAFRASQAKTADLAADTGQTIRCDQPHGTGVAAAQQGSGASTPVADATPTERIEAAERELRVALAADSLERTRTLDHTAFEQLIVDLLVRMGYGGSHREAAARLGRTGDGGVDGVIREDALGLDAVYIQAKRYAADNTVGSGAIREFAGALLTRGATKGVFVTTSSFSNAAKEEARQLASHKRVVLIDGDELARLMIEHEIGVRTVQTVRIQRLDLEAYENEGAA